MRRYKIKTPYEFSFEKYNGKDNSLYQKQVKSFLDYFHLDRIQM